MNNSGPGHCLGDTIKDFVPCRKFTFLMTRHCQQMSYRDRLEHLKLPTLTYRRIRGDMVEVFKIQLFNMINMLLVLLPTLVYLIAPILEEMH